MLFWVQMWAIVFLAMAVMLSLVCGWCGGAVGAYDPWRSVLVCSRAAGAVFKSMALVWSGRCCAVAVAVLRSLHRTAQAEVAVRALATTRWRTFSRGAQCCVRL